jgi:hypothetical protein
MCDERGIDAFMVGLHRADLVEEMGCIKPKTVEELMDVASRFADGEDACHNKRTRSPKMIGPTDTTTRGQDPATMTTSAPTIK